MDYKETLNLPKTGFPMKGDLVAREPERLARWQKMDLYHRIQDQRAGRERFILHDGPPFANGDVHIGNALNKILKDIVVKYHTLRGQKAPYVPGWDCHGLPIEFKVTQEMRKTDAASSDPAAIRKACDVYARKYIDLQRTQFKRLGVLGDWEKPYLTLDKEYEAAELRLFADIVEKGFVYRSKKPIYWSIPGRTALAEAEVEYRDHVSQSIYVKFPVVGRPNTFILIWTTTPWTLPANLAVAYHSSFYYTLVRVGEESYILSGALLTRVAEKCGWDGYEIVRSLDGDHLQQTEYEHPFCARTGKLFAGDAFVDNVTGTGFVHVAPGHGLEDYALGRQHGLPIYSPVDDDGCFTYTNDLPVEQQMPAELIGKSILEKHGKSQANLAVLQQLRLRNALLHQEDYQHSYPYCWRSKTPIIFRAMNQWFIKIDHQNFRRTVLDRINQVQWIPGWGKNRIEGAVTSRPDWCISRQRSWGVPVPAFYDDEGQPILNAQIVRAAADLVEEYGSNIWFEKAVSELWQLLRPADWSGPEAASKLNDTLDVWIDSGSSSRAVLMQREELQHESASHGRDSSAISKLPLEKPGADSATLPWQADMYLEGSDQHRGWFQSSLLLSLAGNGAAPYKTVLTHGFVVDADREKISKSNQGQSTYEKPQTAEAYVKKYGADIVRLWVASQDFRNDIVVSDERISKVGETYRLIRNTLRYQLSNLYDFDPARHAVTEEQLTGLDRWILHHFRHLEDHVFSAYERYEFHAVYQRISQFAAVELSGIYHDVVKDRLYTDAPQSSRRRSTQTTLCHMLASLCRMLAPILSFTADEAWEFVPGRTADSVHLLDWTPGSFAQSETDQATWKTLFAFRELSLPELEKARQAKIIGKALEAKLVLSGSPEALKSATENKEDLRELLNVSQLELNVAMNAASIAATVTKAEGQKCGRCWHWEIDVGSNAEHPTICGRCVREIGASVAT